MKQNGTNLMFMLIIYGKSGGILRKNECFCV